MALSKQKAKKLIQEVFKKQGGTGFSGCMAYGGAKDAVTAIRSSQLTPDETDTLFDSGIAPDLVIAHDDTLVKLKQSKTPGIITGDKKIGGRYIFRAKYGSKAYKEVIKKINAAIDKNPQLIDEKEKE